MPVPRLGFVRHPKPTQVPVSFAIPEPTAHLVQGVGGTRVSQEITRRKTFQRKDARKRIATDCYDANSWRFIDRAVVQTPRASALVHCLNSHRRYCIMQTAQNVRPTLARMIEELKEGVP